MVSLRRQLYRARARYNQIALDLQSPAYGAVMRLRRLGHSGEIEAAAPFDRRMLYQHKPRVGRDGYLFHLDHDALDQLSGTIVLRPRQLAVWTEAMRRRLEWCDRHGAAVRFLVIPEKHVVYRDKLPLLAHISRRRPAMQLLEALDGRLRDKTLYPVEALVKASKFEATYFKTDTHWTPHGAFVAYRELLDSLRSDIALHTVREDAFERKERPFVGDLGVRFICERGETRTALKPSENYKLVFQNNRFSRGAIHVYQNVRRDLPTCVLFRDSFSNFLIPYLMQGFSDLIAVSSLSCHYDLLEQQRPDVVLFVSIERFLATFGRGTAIELPQDAERQSFEDFSGTALEQVVPGQKVYHAKFDALSAERMPPLVFTDLPAGSTGTSQSTANRGVALGASF